MGGTTNKNILMVFLELPIGPSQQFTIFVVVSHVGHSQGMTEVLNCRKINLSRSEEMTKSFLFILPGELAIIYRDLLTLCISVQDGHKRMIWLTQY